jgi:type VI secretion system protein VasD
MTPGQFKFIDDFEINTETNYIGVMAKFSEPDLSEWKKAVKILNRGRIYHLLMFFNDYEVKLKKVE